MSVLLVQAVEVPVGFHGHNNLGLSVANALAAVEAGAASLDGAIGGLARSAGNAPTEMLCAVLQNRVRPLISTGSGCLISLTMKCRRSPRA